SGAIQVNSGCTFNEQGGSVIGDLTNQGTFNYTSGDFADRLFNYGAANFFGNFTAGDGLANYGTITVNPAITLTLNGTGLDNSGILNLAGGALAGNGPLTNNSFMSGYGTIAGSAGFINNGFFTQAGGFLFLNNTGPNTNVGVFDLVGGTPFILGGGATLSNQGTFNLNGAVVSGAGALHNDPGGTIQGQGIISSGFANSGGVLQVDSTTNIIPAFSNCGVIDLITSGAILTGGAITNTTGTIQGQGIVGNSIANTGTIKVLGGDLTLSGGSITNNVGGLITIPSGLELLVSNGVSTNAGTIQYRGTFDNNNNPLSNTGFISGSGTWASGTLTNAGTFQMTGGTSLWDNDVDNQVGGSFQVTDTTVNFLGTFNNSGTVKSTDADITFTGDFIYGGAYISDPSPTPFSNLIVPAGGYLLGFSQDVFQISNNFDNESTQNTLWNTAAATLQFITGTETPTSHDFHIPGTDQGATFAGYNNNFAWGTLDIAGQTVNLFDGSGTNGGALYAGLVLGADLNEVDLIVNNILNSNGYTMNIYYNPLLDDNEYLGGLTYDFLSGHGQLIPTPLPGSVLLLGTGLLGLGLLGRRRKRG
ncbi:MAG: hypothetical protein P8X65_14750, partial [Syntrophobacterales bacterium]